MNIGEAQAVSRLLRFVCDLELFELAGDDPDVDEARLPDDAGFLAGRVRQALGAGPDPDDVARRVEALLFLPEEDGHAFEEDGHAFEEDERHAEDVPVAGGQL